VINWLLGFLPAPVRYGIMAAGVVCYLVALIKPGTALAGWCMMIAGLTGATSLFSAAKESIEKGKKLQLTSASLSASLPVQFDSLPELEESIHDPAVASGVSNQSTAGHTQRAADEYQDSIFKP
jgi:hypothetical protein